MLAFLCVSINSIATQSIANVVLAALYDCNIMIAVSGFLIILLMLIFFFYSCFSNFSEFSLLLSLVWSV